MVKFKIEWNSELKQYLLDEHNHGLVYKQARREAQTVER